ncbi:MAG TPA: N-acetylmuramoyl-L-alanine amidase [Candidatus Acidoferrales bacterium]|nr:N-acetylmuramoyl-L-alanine amidase [Candidatus Acidoferrales bacterium]
MRNSKFSLTLLAASALAAFLFALQIGFATAQQTEPQTAPAPQQALPTQVAPPPPAPTGSVIVLDPAHGGTDTGARGENGLAEKDIVLQIARAVREQLTRDAYRVLLTRNDDSNPSYDDRAAMANAYRDAIFVSLHVSSTGAPGTVHAYYDQFAAPLAPAATSAGAKAAALPSSGLTSWEDAQRPYVDASHRLADFIQADLGQSFPGSPTASIAAPVRALRSISAPAVAIEVSSVSGSTAEALNAAAGPIAAAIAHGISALRQTGPAGFK